MSMFDTCVYVHLVTYILILSLNLRAAPFVEHLPNKRKIYYCINLQKKKIKLYFHTWFLFVIQGVKFKHFE